MKKIAFLIAAAFASLGTAHAQATYTEVQPKQGRFFVGMGFTGGGDDIATVRYTNGDKGDVTFGSLIQMGAGYDYRINDQISFQGSINYHVSSEGADNGSVRFTRVPMELIVYFNVSPQWRLGAGARHVSSAKISSSGVANVGNYKFDSTLGTVVEAEYAMGRNVGVKLRYVAEKYEIAGFNGKADGNHIGIFGNYYF
jgi:hypothetical protein